MAYNSGSRLSVSGVPLRLRGKPHDEGTLINGTDEQRELMNRAQQSRQAEARRRVAAETRQSDGERKCVGTAPPLISPLWSSMVQAQHDPKAKARRLST